MHSDKMFSSIVSSRNVYGFTTKVKSDKRVKSNPEGMDDPVKLYASRGNEYYVDRKNIEKGIEAIDCYKVYTPFANNIGTDLSDDNINTIIGKPGTIATETYLVIGSNVNLNEKTAGNISRYMKTKFVRFLISLAKANQNGTQKTYAFVPMQDFSSSSEINWSSNNLDEQLYKKYNCSKAEIDYIMTNIADLK